MDKTFGITLIICVIALFTVFGASAVNEDYRDLKSTKYLAFTLAALIIISWIGLGISLCFIN